jgi:hypothetical protein
MLLRPLFALLTDVPDKHGARVSVAGVEALTAIGGLLGCKQRWPSDSHVHVMCAASDACEDGLRLVFTNPLEDVRLDFSMPVWSPGGTTSWRRRGTRPWSSCYVPGTCSGTGAAGSYIIV